MATLTTFVTLFVTGGGYDYGQVLGLSMMFCSLTSHQQYLQQQL
jgi:hypothetical protein